MTDHTGPARAAASARGLDDVRALAARTATRYEGTSLGTVASLVVATADEPFRLAIAGRVKAGKSTLLNAIVGEPLAPTDAGECTRVVTWYRHGHTRSAVVEHLDGTRRPVPVTRADEGVQVELGAAPADVARLEIAWPSGRLAALTLIDTPGIGAIDGVAAAASALALRAEDDPLHAVDAVVYLTNQVHPEDWRMLETFTDDAGVRPDPSCAVALLSRADEVAGGAPDALDTARLLAARLAGDASVRHHCQTVLPLSALLAAGAARLTDEQHRALVALAGDRATDEALRTATRFTSAGGHDAATVPAAARRRLLEQLGLFGVRAAVSFLRSRPSTTGPDLAAHLWRLSGVDELLTLVDRQFLRRRNTLRTRSLLTTLRRAALAHAGDTSDVLAEVERIEAADHELAEMEVLAEWRAGHVELRPADGEDLLRWLDGTSEEATPLAELAAGVERWRRIGEHPLCPPQRAAAAAVVVRSIERRLAAALARPGDG